MNVVYLVIIWTVALAGTKFHLGLDDFFGQMGALITFLVAIVFTNAVLRS